LYVVGKEYIRMTITIIATPKATDANSYATVAQGDTYHETHLYAGDWTGATDERKKAALVWATRMLDDAYQFVGWRTTTTQKLAWPRVGVWKRDNVEVDDDTIPDFLSNAASELARSLLTADRTAEPETKGFSEIGVGPITLKIDKRDAALAPISDAVYEMLKDYATLVSTGGSVKLVRA
jgi:hypothetical protein